MSLLRIAVASGKGGTGKTTIATSLALVLAHKGERVTYLDCDVEEPNGHFFLNPELEQSQPAGLQVPVVDQARCTYCGQCGAACRHSAIIVMQQQVLLFPKLCHGCGGCVLACPEGALQEVLRPVGVLERGQAGSLGFVQGRLDVGEALSPPLIKAVGEAAPSEGTSILDSPPGTSCPVIETLKYADVVLLVTEPTPFGLNDLELAVEMVRAIGLPFGVAINRAGIGDDGVATYCRREGIPVLLEIPDRRDIAEGYSRGEPAVTSAPELRSLLELLGQRLQALATGPRPQRRPRAAPGLSEAETPPPLVGTAGSEVPEVVVISGKGGTGKTSLVACFAALAEDAVIADCDVDAADLHLILEPEIEGRWPFSGVMEAALEPAACSGCGLCFEHCRFEALVEDPLGKPVIEAISCEGCGVCVDLCPERALRLVPSASGEWYISRTRFGPLVHARLGIAQAASGKLVTLLRRQARELAGQRGGGLLISDGSPGIGCPVIASVTGAQLVLIVSEPTLSALHDMKRVAELARSFKLPTALCVNKSDINSELSVQLEQQAAALGVTFLGRLPFDPAVTQAQVARRALVELGPSPAGQAAVALWRRVHELLTGAASPGALRQAR